MKQSVVIEIPDTKQLPEKVYLTMSQFASLSGLPYRLIKTMVRNGLLKMTNTGGRRKIHYEEINSLPSILDGLGYREDR